MNTVKIIETQQELCGIIIEINQVILFLLILNLLNTKQISHEKNPKDNDSLTNAKVVIPLKHLSNFWKSLNISLINSEVELILTWSKNCALTDITTRNAQGDNPAVLAPFGAKFKIADTTLYVPVVTLSKENDIKPLEQL